MTATRDTILADLAASIGRLLSDALYWQRTDGGLRNDNAVRVAQGHDDIASSLRNITDVEQAKAALAQAQQAATCRAMVLSGMRQFNDHDKGYALHIHEQARTIYAHALTRMREVKVRVKSITFKLLPMLEFEGGQRGCYSRSITVSTGLKMDTARRYASDVSSDINFKMSADLSKLTTVGGAGEGSLALKNAADHFRSAADEQTREVKFTETFNLNMEDPFYVYQARIEVLLSDGTSFSLGSPALISCKRRKKNLIKTYPH